MPETIEYTSTTNIHGLEIRSCESVVTLAFSVINSGKEFCHSVGFKDLNTITDLKKFLLMTVRSIEAIETKGGNDDS